MGQPWRDPRTLSRTSPLTAQSVSAHGVADFFSRHRFDVCFVTSVSMGRRGLKLTYLRTLPTERSTVCKLRGTA